LGRFAVRWLVALVAAFALTPAVSYASSGASAASSEAYFAAAGAPDPYAAVPGVEHLDFAAGPYEVTPGANLILLDYKHVPKPNVDGFMVRMAPNLRYALPNGRCCGKVPLTSVIHLHHGVWLSNGTAGEGEGDGYGGFYPFMGSGEEKTIYEFPAGYGYPIGAHDLWVLNYMIHNLTDRPSQVYITYDMDFIPATSPLASRITPVHPIWMDVEDHHIYSVFNVQRGSGHDGEFTFPDMAKDPYGKGPPLNEFTIDHAGTLVTTAGHVHPGGLYDELDLIRAGDPPRGGAIRGTVPDSVRLFRSFARYFDKNGPISWDMAMTATAPNWRVNVKPGDVLRISATYNSSLASWYEVMGIMVVWEAWNDPRGVDPFTHRLNQQGYVTHDRLPENIDHGGIAWIGVNPTAAPDCAANKVDIVAFHYVPGGFDKGDPPNCIPTINRGQSLTFVNQDASPFGTFGGFGSALTPNPFYLQSIFHTVTSCKGPCNKNYGISYPLASGLFDSGQLGIGTPGVGRLTWSTSKSLAPGTYYFFCRIHPWMRGVFRIIG
jgi:hypothetical protein